MTPSGMVKYGRWFSVANGLIQDTTVERGQYTTGMKLIEMRAETSTHLDFKNEEH